MILKNIQRWLANSKRDYHEGLRYFNLFASTSKKERYGQYLNDVPKSEKIRNDAGNSSRFSLLIDEIVRIEGDIRRNPNSFKQAIAQPTKIESAQIQDTGTAVSTKTPQSGEPKLTTDPGTAGSGQSPATKDPAPIQIEKSTLDSLPSQFDESKARLKEIIPIMAKLHADMANEAMADDKRLLIVNDLVRLDAERRDIWSKIDAFLANGGTPIEKSPDEKLIEEQSLALGAKMQKRIDQLRENISRNEKSLITAQRKSNKILFDNAEKRIEKYKAELSMLEEAVKK